MLENNFNKTEMNFSLMFQPENVVCTHKDSNSLKIIDFGLAKKILPEEKVCLKTSCLLCF